MKLTMSSLPLTKYLKVDIMSTMYLNVEHVDIYWKLFSDRADNWARLFSTLVLYDNNFFHGQIARARSFFKRDKNVRRKATTCSSD